MYTFLKSSHQAGSNHMKKPYCVFLPLIPGFAPEWLIFMEPFKCWVTLISIISARCSAPHKHIVAGMLFTHVVFCRNLNWALNRPEMSSFLSAMFNTSSRVEPPFQALAQRIGSLITAFEQVETKQKAMIDAVPKFP